MIALNDVRLESVPESLREIIASGRTKADISTAASQLAKLRSEARNRPRRIFTGRIGRKRGWRGMKVVLPGGHIGELIKARRGAAFVVWRDEFALNPNQHGALWVADLKRFKVPAAVVLGSRKRGVKEQPSAKKASAARINGRCPPRSGSRPRGRPGSLGSSADK